MEVWVSMEKQPCFDGVMGGRAGCTGRTRAQGGQSYAGRVKATAKIHPQIEYSTSLSPQTETPPRLVHS